LFSHKNVDMISIAGRLYGYRGAHADPGASFNGETVHQGVS
jgi:hypothetical protein